MDGEDLITGRDLARLETKFWCGIICPVIWVYMVLHHVFVHWGRKHKGTPHHELRYPQDPAGAWPKCNICQRRAWITRAMTGLAAYAVTALIINMAFRQHDIIVKVRSTK